MTAGQVSVTLTARLMAAAGQARQSTLTAAEVCGAELQFKADSRLGQQWSVSAHYSTAVLYEYCTVLYCTACHVSP